MKLWLQKEREKAEGAERKRRAMAAGIMSQAIDKPKRDKLECSQLRIIKTDNSTFLRKCERLA